jgi:hypothetical protein
MDLMKREFKSILTAIIISEMIIIPCSASEPRCESKNDNAENELLQMSIFAASVDSTESIPVEQDSTRQKILFEPQVGKQIVSRQIILLSSSKFRIGSDIRSLGDNGINLKEAMGNNAELNDIIDEAYYKKKSGNGFLILGGAIALASGIVLYVVDAAAKADDPYYPDYEETISVPALVGIMSVGLGGIVLGAIGLKKMNSFGETIREAVGKYNETVE